MNENIKKIINWRGISEILTGSPIIIRANRENKANSKELESLEKHLTKWIKENDISIK